MGGQLIIPVLSFLSVFFGIFAVNLVLVDLFKRDRERMLRKMEEERRSRQRKEVRQSALARRDQQLGQLAEEAKAETNASRSVYERLQELVAQSGMRITTSKLITISAVAAVLLGGAAGVLFRSVWVGLIVGAIGGSVPLLYVARVRRKRQDQLRDQLPDVLELMARIMRAGQTITQGMSSVASEFRPPISAEFGYCYEQQNLGLSPEVALRDLAQRTGVLEIKILVLGILVQRQSGGNLAELLDKLAEIVRQRFRVRGEIKTLTAEGRMQALILMGLPIFMWAALFFLNREYALKLLAHPKLVIGTLVTMTVGAFWIRKIVNFDF